MRILVCCKVVPEEQDIIIAPDRSLNIAQAAYKINAFDLNAIQSAVDLAAQQEGSQVIALSIGGVPLENAKLRKDILSRGVDELSLVIDASLQEALPAASAQVLAAAAQKTGFDLIICGDGSGDLYAQQTALLVGHHLGICAINAVSKIISIQDGKLVVERTLEKEVEVLELSLPAIIAVTSDINEPKVPAMKAILAAGKKPVHTSTLADLNLQTSVKPVTQQTLIAPEQAQRQQAIIEGDGEEQLAAFVGNLRKIYK